MESNPSVKFADQLIKSLNHQLTVEKRFLRIYLKQLQKSHGRSRWFRRRDVLNEIHQIRLTQETIKYWEQKRSIAMVKGAL